MSKSLFYGATILECLDHAVPYVVKMTGSTSKAWTKFYDHAVIKTSN